LHDIPIADTEKPVSYTSSLDVERVA